MNIPWSTVISAIIAVVLAGLVIWLWQRKNGNGNGAAQKACELATENSARCRQLEQRLRALEHRADNMVAEIRFLAARIQELKD